MKKVDIKKPIEKTTSITNNRNILNYIVEYDKEKLKKQEYHKLLTGDLREVLKEKFGEHTATFKGEFNFKIWFFEHDNNVYQILSAKDYGTSLEIDLSYGDTLKNTKTIISFLDELIKELF